MPSLAGKVAIVTGASRGIGRAIALRLSQEGASVVVNYARGADQAKDVVSAIEAAGGKALAVQADVAKPQKFAICSIALRKPIHKSIF